MAHVVHTVDSTVVNGSGSEEGATYDPSAEEALAAVLGESATPYLLPRLAAYVDPDAAPEDVIAGDEEDAVDGGGNANEEEPTALTSEVASSHAVKTSFLVAAATTATAPHNVKAEEEEREGEGQGWGGAAPSARKGFAGTANGSTVKRDEEDDEETADTKSRIGRVDDAKHAMLLGETAKSERSHDSTAARGSGSVDTAGAGAVGGGLAAEDADEDEERPMTVREVLPDDDEVDLDESNGDEAITFGEEDADEADASEEEGQGGIAQAVATSSPHTAPSSSLIHRDAADRTLDYTTAFPVSRVRELLKFDATSSIIAREAVVAATEATALILRDLAKAAADEATRKQRKTVTYDDLARVVQLYDRFAFLSDVLPPVAAAVRPTNTIQIGSASRADTTRPLSTFGGTKRTAAKRGASASTAGPSASGPRPSSSSSTTTTGTGAAAGGAGGGGAGRSLRSASGGASSSHPVPGAGMRQSTLRF